MHSTNVAIDMVNFDLFNGDCLEILKELPDNFFDAIVTDPPYGLAFMGKRWDYDVPSVEIWREALRVLKPGGHLLSFGGTRTYHRLVIAIEDAGFEIRDRLQWIYGSGFPKSLNIRKEAIKKGFACDCEPNSEHNVRSLSDANIQTSVNHENQSRKVLQSSVSQQSMSEHSSERASLANRREESGMEGRNNLQAEQGELCGTQIRSVSQGISRDVSEGRLRDGTSSGDGHASRSNTYQNGSRASQGSQHSEQLDRESSAVPEQSGTQACRRCGKQKVSEGLGTALKPANEPICLARKPLGEKTVAQNVLTHGTGGLNIDATRVESPDADLKAVQRCTAKQDGHTVTLNIPGHEQPMYHKQGRFPSNVILDEVAAKLLDEQSGSKCGAQAPVRKKATPESTNVDNFKPHASVGDNGKSFRGDSGGASRFFYCAKASKKDRNGGLAGTGITNVHATVKPTSLMEYLIKLVTPPGGIVLDPFMGSGTTGVAAVKNGFSFIGCEMDEGYHRIADARIRARLKNEPELVSEDESEEETEIA